MTLKNNNLLNKNTKRFLKIFKLLKIKKKIY